MKVLKNIFKWLVCVFLTFATIFTINILSSGELVDKIMLALNPVKYEKQFEENAYNSIKTYDESIKNIYSNNENNEQEEENKLSKQYKQYPAGTAAFFIEFTIKYGLAISIIYSLIAGIIFGTVIFLLINSKEKKEIKFVILFYLTTVIALGFIQGIQIAEGENLKIIDYWDFPSEYIVPVTVAFGLVILVRVIKQKDLARKLNEKLKERKQADK